MLAHVRPTVINVHYLNVTFNLGAIQDCRQNIPNNGLTLTRTLPLIGLPFSPHAKRSGHHHQIRQSGGTRDRTAAGTSLITETRMGMLGCVVTTRGICGLQEFPLSFCTGTR